MYVSNGSYFRVRTKNWKKSKYWKKFFSILQTFARSWQGCHRRTKGTQVCEEKSNFRQKKARKVVATPERPPTDAVGTSECWLEVVVFSSKERPLLLGRSAAGTAADLRLWGGGPAPLWGSEGGAGSGPTERLGETQAGRSQVTLGADRPKHSDISTADKEGA